MVSLVASTMPRYSDSVDESATQDCFLADHVYGGCSNCEYKGPSRLALIKVSTQVSITIICEEKFLEA